MATRTPSPEELAALAAGDPVAVFKEALGARMAELEDTVKGAGGDRWEAVIVAYVPELPDAYVVVESTNAVPSEARAVLAKVADAAEEES